MVPDPLNTTQLGFTASEGLQATARVDESLTPLEHCLPVQRRVSWATSLSSLSSSPVITHLQTVCYSSVGNPEASTTALVPGPRETAGSRYMYVKERMPGKVPKEMSSAKGTRAGLEQGGEREAGKPGADRLRASLLVAKGHGVPRNVNGPKVTHVTTTTLQRVSKAIWQLTCPYQVLGFVASP